MKVSAQKAEIVKLKVDGLCFDSIIFYTVRLEPAHRGPRKKNKVHIGGRPYIRGWASHFNALLFRTFVILKEKRVAWDSDKPFPVR